MNEYERIKQKFLEPDQEALQDALDQEYENAISKKEIPTHEFAGKICSGLYRRGYKQGLSWKVNSRFKRSFYVDHINPDGTSIRASVYDESVCTSTDCINTLD
jgi:hypothetical protein